jgi:hypothetical protein
MLELMFIIKTGSIKLVCISQAFDENLSKAHSWCLAHNVRPVKVRSTAVFYPNTHQHYCYYHHSFLDQKGAQLETG